MALSISTGTIPRAQKVVLYGVEGIGKTTLASQMPDPLFIDTEGGTAFMDVKRVDGVNSWEDLLATVREVAGTPGVCKTLVIDTADWAEQVMIQHILKKNNWDSLESPGYGKGYTYLGEEWAVLLKECNRVIDAGMNVVITAHAKMRKQELPDEMGAFDRWELKLTRQVAPLLKEWADCVLFCNYKTLVITTENNVKKGAGGRRVIYTAHKPAFDAKNRHGLPEEMDMAYENIAVIFKGTSDAEKPVSGATLAKLQAQMDKAEVKSEEVCAVLVAKKGYPEGTKLNDLTEGFVNGWLRQNWNRVVKEIVNNPERVPF